MVPHMGSIPHCSTGTPGPCWFSSPCAGSDDSDTQQTVREMCAVIKQCAADPLMQDEARRCFQILNFARVGTYSELAAQAAYSAAKSRLKFKLDEVTLQRLLNKRGERDFLQWPTLVVRGVVREGDCDCFTMYMLCLLECLGVPWRIVTVKCDPHAPDRWAHVYAVIDLEDGRRLPLDASHFKRPGEEVPANHVFEYAEWDMEGNRMPIQFRPVPMGAYRSRGFGDPGDPMSEDPYAGLTPDQLAALASAGAVGDPLTGSPLPSSSPAITPATASALANLASAWTKIAGQVIAPQTTIQTPQGLLVTGPSGAIQNTALPGISSLTAGGAGGLLPIIAILGGGFLLFSLMKK